MPVQGAQLTELAPRSGTAFVLERGDVLTIVDPEGEQVADLVAFAADDPREALSNGRTFDYEQTIALTAGNRLWSNRSRPLLTIVRDDVGTHDFLLTPCSRDTWRLCYGGLHDDVPGCFGNLAAVLAPHGIAPDAIPTAFNVFMRVELDPAGRIRVLPPRSRPGDAFAVRAEERLIVGLTACSAAQSNNGRCKPVRFEVKQPGSR
ncbi:MAG TPA: urea carboxylase-associated family protein [Candidatus Elarobacter sp.]